MATDNNILGLRAQIAGKSTALISILRANARTANMRALDMHPAAEIITVEDEGLWNALIVKGSEVIHSNIDWLKTPEAALRGLLEVLSAELWAKFDGQS